MEAAEFLPAATPPSRRLIVVLHGTGSRTADDFYAFIQAIREDAPDADILYPQLAYRSFFSTVPATAIATKVIQLVDSYWDAKGGYADILIVGQSAGGALARKVLLGGWGVAGRIPFEEAGNFKAQQKPREWPGKVSRLVLLAGITAGWSVTGREAWKHWLAFNFYGALGHLIPGITPTLFEFRRGAPFIVNTRLQWIDHVRQGGARTRTAVVQLLGSLDGIVSPSENLDFDPGTALGKQLFILEVPNSDHVQLLHVSEHPKRPNDAAFWPRRRELLRSALFGALPGRRAGASGIAPLKDVTLDWRQLDDHMPTPADLEVRNAVFVIHGIRDDGFWTKKIASRIKRAARAAGAKPEEWVSITPSYGYFTMLPFVFKWIRRRKVEWLMDLYAYTAAQFPNADFHYVGHSNGTYLGAAAMRDYEGCRFKHVAFAGSVVHPSYDWKARTKDSGVEKVLNFVASRDFVVALAPNAMRNVRSVFDLGGAGHLDFSSASRPLLHSDPYVIGGHSAGIAEDRWQEIADFIVNGTPPVAVYTPEGGYQKRQGAVIRALGRLSPLVAIIAVAIGLGILVDMTGVLIGYPLPPWLSQFVALGEPLPVVGGVFAYLAGIVRSVAAAWHDAGSVVQFIGLLAYAGFLRFLTTRF